MTTYKQWGMAAAVIAMTALFAGFILLGNQRLAHAQVSGSNIDQAVFCFLDQFPTTDVFGTNCAPTPTTGTITIIKDVSGTTTPVSDFDIHLLSSGIDVNGSPQPGSNTGTAYGNLDAGTYTVSESLDPSAPAYVDLTDFTPSYTGDCSGTDSIDLTASSSLTCSITNTYTPAPPPPTTGALVVKKVVVNTGGGVATASDFSFGINGAATTTFSSNGENDFSSETPGTYSVAETASSTYTPTYSDSNGGDCSDMTVTAGATTTCTITNTYVPPTPPSCTIVSDTNTVDATDGHAAVLVTPLNAAWTATSTATYDPSAAWVWSENPAINTDVNVTKDFTRTFNIAGTPTDASIDIAADNGFVLIVNGTTVEDASTTSNYSTSQHFDITSDLVTGSNTVEADVTNFGVPGSNGSNNPAGLIFQVNLPDNSCTSGGGGGSNTSDLSVTKTVNDSTPTEGDQVIYTISVNNAGPDSASGVTVTDLLPANLTYVSDDGAGAYNSTTGVWTIGTIADEGSATLHITATVGNTTSTITNTASITSDDSTDPNSGNNSGSASITPVAPGSTNVTQTIVVSPEDMQGWQIENYHTPDNGVTYIDEGSATTTDGTGGYFVYGPATPPLGVGSFQDVVGTTGNDGTLMDTSAYNGMPLSDITALTYETYVQQNMGEQATYLAINISTSTGATTDTLFFEPVYQNGTYSLLPYATTPVPNQCGADPDCVTLNTWQSWNAQEGGWWSNNDSAGGPPLTTLADYVKEYPSAEIATDGPSVAVQAGFGAGAWNNFVGNFDDVVIGTTEGTNATTTTYDFDPDSSDIGVTKTVDNSTPNVGDTVTYTITASDTGNDATGVVVTDLLPSGLTFVSTTTPDVVGTYASSTGEWDIGDLSSTTPAVLHIEATVNSGESNGTVITNTATVTSGDTSGDTSNDSASAPVTVTIPSATPNTPSGGGGGGGGGGGNGPIVGAFGGGGGGGGPIGQVLGASTSTVPLTSCTQYLTGFIKLGGNNDAGQVTRLQEFLDQFEGDNVPIDGTYDQATYQAVKAFQQKYASDILTPWGENTPTGYVYLTTRREVNTIYCNYTEQFPLTAAQQAVINAYKDEVVGGQGSATNKNAGANTPTNTNANTNTGTTNGTTTQNQGTQNLGEVGAAAAIQNGGGFWSGIGNFFSHIFHH